MRPRSRGVHGSAPWVTSSFITTMSPARGVMFSIPAGSCSRVSSTPLLNSSGGRSNSDLWEPGTTTSPPSPGWTSVR